MKTLKSRLGRIMILVAASLATACWVLLQPPEDPECNGIRLSRWLDASDGDLSKSPIQKDDLRAIAPKAAPFLAHYLRCNDPNRTSGFMERMRNRLQGFLPPSMRMTSRFDPRESHTRCGVALEALFWLGRDAEPALPTLLRMLEDPQNAQAAGCAKVIHGMGPSSWPVVRQILRHGSSHARMAVLFALPSRLEGSPPPVPQAEDKELTIRLLLEACLDPDPRIQVQALHSLAQCWRNPHGSLALLDPAIPVLIRCMEEGTGRVPAVAASTSSLFPQHAATILPALEKLAHSPDPAYRQAANEALKSLKPKRHPERGTAGDSNE